MIKATVNNSTTISIKDSIINNKDRKVDLVKISENNFHLLLDNQSFQIQSISYNYKERKVILIVNGNEYELVIKDKIDLLLQEMGINVTLSTKHNQFKAPMPGLIKILSVVIGQEVKKGDVLIVLEAMKMENALKAVADMKVKNILVNTGQAVEKNQLLIERE